MKLTQVGEIGKALAVLVNAAPLISPTYEMFNKLLQKYPTSGQCLLTPDQLQQMENFQLSEDIQPIVIDQDK
jgi:hypothetical protein